MSNILAIHNLPAMRAAFTLLDEHGHKVQVTDDLEDGLDVLESDTEVVILGPSVAVAAGRFLTINPDLKVLVFSEDADDEVEGTIPVSLSTGVEELSEIIKNLVKKTH